MLDLNMKATAKAKDSGALLSSWIQLSILAASHLYARMKSKCDSPHHLNPGCYCKKTQACRQGQSHRLTGHSDGLTRWIRSLKYTPRRDAPLFRLSQRNGVVHCLAPCYTAWSVLQVKMISLHFKSVISLLMVKNLFVISCWFCWFYGNNLASEILKSYLKKSDTIGSSYLLGTVQEDVGFVLYY